jgi:pimeloyl-ACP methyl ester carboxylesterase
MDETPGREAGPVVAGPEPVGRLAAGRPAREECPMPSFRHDGIDFHYLDRGEGLPLIILHGLGGDVSQPALLFQPPPGFRLITFDARGHGETRPLGPEERIGIAATADDLLALMGRLEIDRAIVGGISMGAAVALNFALRHPDRLLGLILSRPAWLDRPAPEHLRIFVEITRFLRAFGPEEGRRRFEASEAYRRLADVSRDCARTLADQFRHPRAAETAVKFERFAMDGPCRGRRGWGDLHLPTLVMANRDDPIHPLGFGEALAEAIPGATFRELTPKSVSLIGHGLDIREALDRYLTAHFAAAAR